MTNNHCNVEVKMVSEWCNLAVKAKRAGCPNPTVFLMQMMLHCIRVPPWEIEKIRKAWKDEP